MEHLAGTRATISGRHHLQELEDCEHKVVDVAEPAGLALLGVVEASSPVDGNVGLARIELHRSTD